MASSWTRRVPWAGILVVSIAILIGLLIWRWMEANVDSNFKMDANISIGDDEEDAREDSKRERRKPRQEKKNGRLIDQYYDGIARFEKDGLYGYITQDGREVVPAQYEDADIKFYEDLAWVVKNGKYGFINKNRWGETTIPLEYDYASRFKNGFAEVTIGDKTGKINPEGVAYGIDTPMEDIIYDAYFEKLYMEIEDFHEDRAAVLSYKTRKWGFINTYGDLVIPAIYDEVAGFKDDRVWVKKGNSCGIIDFAGNEIIPIAYEEITPLDFPETIARVREGGLFGFVNIRGEEIVAPRFEDAGFFSEGMAYVMKNGKYGFVDKNGKLVIPLRYDDVILYDEHYAFRSGRAKIRVGDRLGYVYRDGNEWWFD